jgi:hypothetical protein
MRPQAQQGPRPQVRDPRGDRTWHTRGQGVDHRGLLDFRLAFARRCQRACRFPGSP